MILDVDGDNRPHAKVNILGHEIVGLLDSGANLSVLGQNSENLIKKLKLPLIPFISNIKTADGTSHLVTSYVDLPIYYNKTLHNLKTIIVPSLTNELILGMDFWTLFGIRPVIANEINQINALNTKEQIILSDLQTNELNQVIKTFHVATSTLLLGRTNVLCHDINTGDAKPIRQRYYPVSPYVQQEMDTELNRMLALDVIEPCASPWSNPLVVVRRPNKKIRLCLDSRKLNLVSVGCQYPLPYISRILGRIRGTKYLSTIDLSDAFWQVPLSIESRPKTAFVVPGRGMYRFKVMPFGLKNAPGTQSRLMDAVLGYDMEPMVFCYLDDIVVATETFEEHIECLQKISERLKKANLTISISKSMFCVKELKYLGFILGRNGLTTDPEKVSAILHYPSPKNVKEVRSLCGLLSWYRKFVNDFASIVAPITNLTKKNVKTFKWTEEAEEALNKMKIILTSNPVLFMPDFSKPFVIESDASNDGAGGVLLQHIDGQDRVIEYMSQKLSPTQINYSVTEKECLALVLAIEKWRSYIEGARFTVITDHASLKWLYNLKDPSGRLARWALRLLPYDFEILHRKGVNHVVPDALSRCVQTIDLDSDEFLDDLKYNALRDDVAVYPDKFPKLYVDGSIIYCKTYRDQWKLLVPSNLREKLIKYYHDKEISAHQGVLRTYKRIFENYCWENMKSDIKNYISKCEICIMCKYPNAPLRAKMGDPKIPNTPWRMIACDFMGPFPRTGNQNTCLLVVTDIFSKFSLLKPLRHSKSNLLIKFLEENVFLKFGVPEFIISDNGPAFKSKAYLKFCEDYDVTPWKSAVYHAQNNPVERVNLSIGSAIRSYIGKNHRDWDKNIAKIGCALRTAEHGTTKFTPFYLNYGFQMSTSGNSYKTNDVLSQLNQLKPLDSAQKLFSAREEAMSNMRKSHENNSKYYNLRSRVPNFKVGDIVYRRHFVLSNASKHFCEKFAYLFVKAKIKEILGSSCYKLIDEKGKELGVYSAKDLRYSPDNNDD